MGAKYTKKLPRGQRTDFTRPELMPRPDPTSVVEEAPRDMTAWVSPLSAYLKSNGLSKELFARAMGVTFKVVNDWCKGSLPSIPYALEIERVSKGVVFIEQWAAHPSAREMVARLRVKQSPEVQAFPPPAAGGFGRSREALHADKMGKANSEEQSSERDEGEVDGEDTSGNP